MQRFSPKRQSILDCLRSTDTHPGAVWVWEQLKPVYPDLSLATVYRNLSQLKEEGLIISVGYVDGQERFDGRIAPHPHAVCRRCGRVIDVGDRVPPAALAPFSGMIPGFEIQSFDLRLSGVCAGCREKEEKK